MTPQAQRPGYFGDFGGVFVPETLIHALQDLEAAYEAAKRDDAFDRRLKQLLTDYVGRPTPLYEGRRLSEEIGGGRLWFKREDLAHTGAHKINNTIGQALPTARMGRREPKSPPLAMSARPAPSSRRRADAGV